MQRAAGIVASTLLCLLASCGANQSPGSTPTPSAVAATALSSQPPPATETAVQSAPPSTGATPATTPSGPPPPPTAVPPTAPPTTPAPSLAPTGPLGAGSLAVAPALGGRTFDRPVELVAYPDGSFLLADQSGLVTRLATDGRPLGTFLDQRTVTLRSGNEEGLLSIQLDPGFTSNRHVYVYASRANPRRTTLARYAVTSNDTVDPLSELVILEFPQPFPNHNGGAIRFGADGLLYLGLGDGGSGGDPGNRAQNLQELLGKIIRLDVRGATAGQPYRAAGDPGLAARGARAEIWAYGFRNPWRMAFDPSGTTLYTGDVGQDRFEEVERVLPGGNHGWPILEGETCYRPASNCPREGLVPPLAVYPLRTAGNCAVTGGEVLDGSLLYADFCSGQLWAVPVAGGPSTLIVDTALRIASFARGHDGSIYVLAHSGAVHRLVRVR